MIVSLAMYSVCFVIYSSAVFTLWCNPNLIQVVQLGKYLFYCFILSAIITFCLNVKLNYTCLTIMFFIYIYILNFQFVSIAYLYYNKFLSLIKLVSGYCIMIECNEYLDAWQFRFDNPTQFDSFLFWTEYSLIQQLIYYAVGVDY